MQNRVHILIVTPVRLRDKPGAQSRRTDSPGEKNIRFRANMEEGMHTCPEGGRIEGNPCPISKWSNIKRTSEMSKQPKISADQVKDQAAEAGKLARQFADEAKEWAAPRVEAAREWASPKVDKAWRDAVEIAAPRIADAAEKSRSAVDTAHEKLVDDVIPTVVTKMEEAASGAKEGATKVADKASKNADKALKKAEKAAEKQAKKKVGFGRKLGWVLIGGAVAGAGVLLWRRTQPTDDPWAEEYWDDAPAAVSPTVSEGLTAAAEASKEKAAETKE